MSKKRFIILSSLILSFPIAYKLLTPNLMPSPAPIKSISAKPSKKVERISESTSEIAKEMLEKSAALPPTPAAKKTLTPPPTRPRTQTASVVAKSVASPSVALVHTDVNKKAQAILAKAPTLNPKVLKLALTVYSNANKKGMKSKGDLLTIIDYSKPSDHKRLWVLNLKTNQILYNTLAAHGKNTGERHATSFSNQPNSKSSSIGLFMTKETYQGQNGLSLRINGLDKGFNDNALRRAVVFHGAAYVSDAIAKAYGRIGRSWGCPAIPKVLSTPLINTIKNGTLVFAYAPGLMYEVKSKFLKS